MPCTIIKKRSVYREGCWTTFWLCSSSFLTIENCWLQVVYEHWAKPRDVEENKILKSSIGSPLPTCLHCVICKSNNLFMSLFLSFFLGSLSLSASDCRRIVSKHECIQDVRELKSFMARRLIFSCFKIYFYVNTWDRLGKYASKEWLLVFVVTTVHILYKKGIFESCNLPLWCMLKIFFLHASRLQI